MKLRNVLGKTSEFGIGMTAIAILVLAGCGGGSGSGSSSSATCTASGNVSGAAAVNCFFAETVAKWNANLVFGMPNWAGTSSAVGQADSTSFVATGANTYTYRSSYMDLATSSSAWSTGTPPSTYYLAATGWASFDSMPYSYTNNGNGTVTTNASPWAQAEVTALTRTDLTGQPVVCTNPTGSYVVGENLGSASMPVIVAAASCPVAVTYPSGSASYTTTANFTQNELYMLWNSPITVSLTDGAGVSLPALPSLGTRFCLNGLVYDPITGAAAGADNYNAFYNYTSANCSATNISAALGKPKLWTALISLKATGNAAVPNVFDIKTTSSSGTYENFYAYHLGKLMSGSYMPASTSTSTSTDINKTAASAQLRANGLSPLP